ncbi:hypothetical protein P154DRAFT_286406 [Amniculicola lignicola CBS 123094]|uniref:Uncharacterized protein n=1 Tax=Amniculicola lignicola CBS 123094 TaxID=1392246 RepID=A0A6A5X1Q8_9PLEO|nr:hypothetical protein P154DRAFT_286406 [Amniculicola lignicola CBS 123094]
MFLQGVPLNTMIITGVLLVAPIVRADALTDLKDLKTVINSAATTIGTPTNSSRNWGFLSPATGQLGTADLLQNITSSILKAKYGLDIDPQSWINATNATHVGSNLTSLDDPYIEYISAIPNLATALVALGRSWHREMNKPIHEGISYLQEAVNQFSTSLLSSNLTHSNSTMRTIRASNSLEDAQVAWTRILNFPGSSRSPSGSGSGSQKHRRWIEADFDEGHDESNLLAKKADLRPPHPNGQFYSHKELWGRKPNRPFHENTPGANVDNANDGIQTASQSTDSVRLALPFTA